MKIVILVRILWTAGAPKKAIREAIELQSMGHHARVVFLRASSRISGYEDLLSEVDWSLMANQNNSWLVPVYDWLTSLFAPDRKGDGRLDVNLLRKFPRFVEAFQPDLIVCHDQYAGLAGYYAWRRSGTPYVVLLHERVDWRKRGPLEAIIDIVERRTLLHSTRILASTEKIAETARKKHGLGVEANYQGFDLSKFTSYGEKTNSLLAVSTWDRGRQPERYLDAVSELPVYTLRMVGNWRSEAELRRFESEVIQRGLTERVQILRGLAEARLNALYDSSKFVIRFGFGEYGESHAVFEGLQRGTPVIINADLGTAEIVRRFHIGGVVDPSIPAEVAAFVRRTDSVVEYEHFQANIRKAAALFTWRMHAERILGRESESVEGMQPSPRSP